MTEFDGKNELSTLLEEVRDEKLKEYLFDVLDNTPRYRFEKPSCSSGKYHPPADCGEWGNLIHTLNVMKVAKTLAQTKQYINTDVVIAAAFLHDLCKWMSPEDKHTNKMHAESMANRIMEDAHKYNDHDLFYMTLEHIATVVRYHGGRWTPSLKDLPYKDAVLAALPIEATILHEADYIAAQKWFRIEETQEDA